MKTTIMIFALSLCTVCANPEGDKFHKSFDAYMHNYENPGNGTHCEILDVECNRSRLEILQIVADQARAYKATSEAATTLNGKLADVIIEDNDVQHAFYQKLANGGLHDGKDFQPMIDVQKKLVALLRTESDEAFKRIIK